ncbi:secreted protein containing Sulphatase-modifying factor [Candidatus Magnetomorum sp. HK-1]|nr:secreted protein containing Sulphatase-modifying factor [Candidatus Magnetomorum sp. HK-1]
MMIRFLFFFITILLVGIVHTTNAEMTAFYENSYALVIGIDIYPEPKFKNLKSAVADAISVTTFLKDQGFNVITLLNEKATRVSILAEMQNNLARRVQKNDRVLVFFAGHGFTESLSGKDYGYIVPYDGNTSSASYLSMEEIQAQSEKMGFAKHQLFIMDCCFGGLLATRDIPGQTNIPNYIKDVTSRPARQILTAGGTNQRVVDSGSGEHSIFTASLLEALEQSQADQNRDGYITFSEMCSYVVPRATNVYQTPGPGVLPGHGQGEFVFQSPKGAQKPIQEFISNASESFRSESSNVPQKKRPIIKKSNHKTGDLFKEPLTGMELVWISGGCFMMGCDDWAAPCEEFEKPVHEVSLDGFWMGKTEVTQGQWKAVMKDNPAANDSGDTYPVELISWTQALDFIDRLNNQQNEKSPYELPTEAQWEYACRSQGKQEKFSGGNQPHTLAWYNSNSKNMTHPVAKKKSNNLNLLDMSGNVQEWCQDVYAFDAYKRTKPMTLNPVYQGSEPGRVVRGGGWGLTQKYCRCVSRQGMQPEMQSGLVGFRVVKRELINNNLLDKQTRSK